MIKILADSDIPSMICHHPLHLQQAYAYLNHKEGDFPISESLSKMYFPTNAYWKEMDPSVYMPKH